MRTRSCRAIIAVFLLLIPITVNGSDTPIGSPTHSETRKIAAIKADLHATLRAEAVAVDFIQREAAVRDLAALLNEISGHPQTMSAAFRRAAQRVRARFLRVKRAMLDRAADESSRTTVGPQTIETIPPPEFGFGLQIGVGGGPAPAGGGVQAAPADDGAALVELIERTVQRDVWVSNGGPATIVYFQPVHALVINGPASVHDDVAALLVMLRAAGP